jgi:hypothetical protein
MSCVNARDLKQPIIHAANIMIASSRSMDADADSDSKSSPSPPREDAPAATPLLDLRRKALLLAVLAISIWHAGAIVIWMSPSSLVRDRILRMTRTYTQMIKLEQNWAMFAPEPLSANRRVIVRAELDGGDTREADLTSPSNRAMRSLSSLARVGRILKVHDRILAADEPGYTRGFALHTCEQLSRLWGTRVKSVTLIREYQMLNVDTHTLKTSVTSPERATLGTYACLE